MNKRICFLVHNCSDYGGVEAVTSNLANEFSNENTVFVVSVINDGRPNALKVKPGITIERLIPQGLRLRTQQRRLFRPLRRFLRDNRIEILIIMGQYSGFLASPVRPFVKTRFVFCDHGAIMNQWRDPKNKMMRIIASRMCDHTVTLTERSRQDYIDRLHINRNRISCIYNWIAPKIVNDNQYDINSKRIISVGRISEEKGFDLLVQAFRIVLMKHPDWELDIYGDGERMQDIQAQIEELQINNRIHLMGRDPDVISKYPSYAMYALPSYKEGLPLVLLEAKANGLPIISFDILTGPGEIVRDTVDGILIRPYEVEEFADAMIRLIENPEVRKEMSQNARGNLDLFSKESIFIKWQNLIEALV